MLDIQFGTETEFVKIKIPDSFLKDGWGQVDVEIAVNCFQGQVRPWIESWDLEQFTKQLRTLYDCLKGKAELSPRDKQFTLKFVAASGGHIEVSGEAWSQASYENKLEFTLDLDQSYLLVPLSELETTMAKSI